jgi:hypothetical protein
MNRVLSLPAEMLQGKGKKAQQWVLENKNHIRQTERIIELVEQS